jgi:hypothetical protein
MDFNVEAFIHPSNLQILKSTGLHKTAAALNGLDEMTIKHAVAIIGTKARQKRAEMRAIADGITALAELQGQKTAAPSQFGKWLPHVMRALPTAALGGGIGYILAPNDPETEKKYMTQAALLGLLGGTLQSVHNKGV